MAKPKKTKIKKPPKRKRTPITKRPMPRTNLVTRTRTSSQLSGRAAKDIEAEIAAEVSPLETQRQSVLTRGQRAEQDLATLYGNIMPYVRDSATRTAGLAKDAQADVKGIFDASRKQLEDLRSSRAAEAQALAQEIGGPVPLDQMMQGVTEEQPLAAAAAAGGQMDILGVGQAENQYAENFAGKVFPLVQTEETTKTRAQYADQIKEIENEITSIKASKGGRTSKRLSELLEKERVFALEQTQANRDWQMAKRSLTLERQRLSVQKREILAGITDAAERRRMEKQFHREEMDLNKAELALAKEAQALEGNEQDLVYREQAFSLMDQLRNPATETITTTQLVGEDAAGDPIYEDVKTPWSKPPVSNPNTMFEELVARGIPRSQALSAVNTLWPDYSPSKYSSFTRRRAANQRQAAKDKKAFAGLRKKTGAFKPKIKPKKKY